MCESECELYDNLYYVDPWAIAKYITINKTNLKQGQNTVHKEHPLQNSSSVFFQVSLVTLYRDAGFCQVEKENWEI